jgi:hypothetical protein
VARALSSGKVTTFDSDHFPFCSRSETNAPVRSVQPGSRTRTVAPAGTRGDGWHKTSNSIGEWRGFGGMVETDP